MNKQFAKKKQALIGFGKKFQTKKNSIAVTKIPNREIGLAINDRLRKASNK